MHPLPWIAVITLVSACLPEPVKGPCLPDSCCGGTGAYSLQEDGSCVFVDAVIANCGCFCVQEELPRLPGLQARMFDTREACEDAGRGPKRRGTR